VLAANRATAVAGAWLALAGGIWFVIGPAVGLFWAGSSAGLLHAGIGAPIGGNDRAAVEAIGYFYGLGAVVGGLAAFALGRLSIVPAAIARRAPTDESLTRTAPRFGRGPETADRPTSAGAAADPAPPAEPVSHA